MSTSAGQKVTNDPRAKQEAPEAVGIVTSDSLAGESLKGEGHFAEGNPHAAPLKQTSKGLTANTTDTSGATRLDPAVDAEARDAQEGWSETSQLNAGKGLGKESGVGPTYNTNTSGAGTGANTSDEPVFSATGGIPSTSSAGSTGIPIAPTGGYAGAADQARAPGELRPKGANIQEGGFPSDAPNASFNNAEIGSKDDPGRVAEQRFAEESSAGVGGVAGVQAQTGLSGQTGGFDKLKSDENA